MARWVLPLVAVSALLSFFFARGGPVGASPRATCLLDVDCQKGERCIVVPKGDGFATLGQCGEACADDSACANGWSCMSWAEEKGYLVPATGRGEGPRVKACGHPTMR